MIDQQALRALIRQEIASSDVAIKVRQLQALTVRAGVASVGWSGGAVDSSLETVPHGMGVAPSSVVATDGGGDRWCVVEVSAVGSSSFVVQASARDPSGALPGGSQSIFWVAVA